MSAMIQQIDLSKISQAVGNKPQLNGQMIK
jgi:hypothetical protein